MAKITIAGEAVVITSELKREDIELLEKYRPDALILKGGEDGKKPIFRVATTSGMGDINKFGAAFGGVTHDGAGLATITIVGGVSGEDVREAVAEKVGTAILNLNKLEESLPAVLEEISAEKAAILANIEVAQ